jgi:hypothetical protein
MNGLEDLYIKVYALKLVTSDDGEVICISKDGAVIANVNVRITFRFFSISLHAPSITVS